MSAGDHRFLDQLRTGLESCDLHGRSLLLAVSGGADSTALLYGIHALREEFALRLQCAHLNHQLRNESASDAQSVALLCNQLHVPLTVDSRNVAAEAARTGRSIEEAARRERYDFLKCVARECQAEAIAVAHTADDQSETILHNLLRGTGLTGLVGMSATRPLEENLRLVRPLLHVPRAAGVEYLQSLHAGFLEDISNRDSRFTRNRIRHQLLPVLRTDFNPQIDEALRRLGAQAAESQQVIEILADRELDVMLLECRPESCRLNRSRCTDLPRHLLRACFHRVWVRLHWPRQRMGYREWERLADLATDAATHARLSLPGAIEASTRKTLLHLERRR